MNTVSEEKKKKIFSLYYGGDVKHPSDNCPFKFKGIDEQGRPLLIGDWSGGTNNICSLSPCDWDDCKLWLKSLDDITEEQLLTIAGKLSYDIGSCTVELGRLYLRTFTSKQGLIPTSMILWMVDYLRGQGYALPYYGEDLFELGVAIKKEA